MTSRTVIGLAPFLDVACNVLRRARPELDVHRIEAVQGKDYAFDLGNLAGLQQSSVPVFVAIDNRFLSFKRLELGRLLGDVPREAIIGRHAILGDGADVADTAYVGEGAVIGDGARLGPGVCVGARGVVGPGAILERGAWLEPGVIVGANARIGAQTSLSSGVIVADAVEIGALCVLAIPGLIRAAVESRTYLHPAFHEPIRIHG